MKSRILGLLTAGLLAGQASAATLYANQATFLASLGTNVTDTYSAAGYSVGDILNFPGLDAHTDASMSAVLGETDYTTTSFVNNNLIFNQPINPH